MMYQRLGLTIALLAALTLAPATRAATQTAQRRYLPLASVAAPASSLQPSHSGDGTYYTSADGSGNCSFDPTPSDLLVGAMNHVEYAGAALCGAFVAISGPNGSVTVRIVDQCPECQAGSIDLSPQAFDLIAPRSAGRVKITWHVVSPDLSGPISYRIKEGSSQWWTAVQIRNHRNPIAKLEYKDASGVWQAMQRQDYNYFIRPSPNQGLGTGPYSFRVTDSYGNTLVDTGIPLVVGTLLAGKGQFPKQP